MVVRNLSAIQEFMIYRVISDNNGKATKEEILEKLGKDSETKRLVEEKLSMMQRFGLLSIEGNLVTLKKK